MLLGACLAAVLVAMVVAGVTTSSTDRAEAAARLTTMRCADLVVLGARASGQRLTSSNVQAGPEVYATVVAAARSLDPGVSVRLEGVPYPAVPTSRGTQAYLASVREGASMLRAATVELLGSCPDAEVVLAGFSQGAHVVHRTLTHDPLPLRLARRVVAVALIADPTYGRLTDDAHQVRYGSTAPARDGLIGPGPRLPRLLARRTIDFCNPADLVCAFDGTDGEITMAPRAGAAHRTFYEDPDVVADNGRLLAQVISSPRPPEVQVPVRRG